MDQYSINYYSKPLMVRLTKHLIRKMIHSDHIYVHLRIIMKTILDEMREHHMGDCGNESTLVSVVIEQTVEASERENLSPYFLKMGDPESVSLAAQKQEGIVMKPRSSYAGHPSPIKKIKFS